MIIPARGRGSLLQTRLVTLGNFLELPAVKVTALAREESRQLFMSGCFNGFEWRLKDGPLPSQG